MKLSLSRQRAHNQRQPHTSNASSTSLFTKPTSKHYERLRPATCAASSSPRTSRSSSSWPPHTASREGVLLLHHLSFLTPTPTARLRAERRRERITRTSGAAAGAAGCPRAESDTEYNRGDTRRGIRSTLLTAAALGVAAFAFAAAAVVEKRTRTGRAPAGRAGRRRAPPLVLQGVRGFCPLAALLAVFLQSGRNGGSVGMGLAEAARPPLSDEQFKMASWGTFLPAFYPRRGGSIARRPAPSCRRRRH